jgi:DNA primase
MINTKLLREKLDVLSLAQSLTAVKRVASTQGGEWAGSCPFCGGQDRFRVQPFHQNGGRWMCRNCTDGRWWDGIELGRRLWPALSFQEVCRQLGGHFQSNVTQPRAVPLPALVMPSAAWRANAQTIIDECVKLLWEDQGAVARAWLRQRGIGEQAMLRWKLGYNPTSREIAGLWIHNGMLIPCVEADRPWYIKIRLLPGLPFSCSGCKQNLTEPGLCPFCQAKNKYRGVKGSCTRALFGVDTLSGHHLAVLAEGEFDAILLHQAAGDLAGVITLGSASSTPDVNYWGSFLLPIACLLLAYDLDEAGQTGAKRLLNLSDRAHVLAVPKIQAQDKDLTDFHVRGGNLRAWLSYEINRLGCERRTNPVPTPLSNPQPSASEPFTTQILGEHLLYQAEKASASALALEKDHRATQAKQELERFARLWAAGREMLGFYRDIPWADWEESITNNNSISDQKTGHSTLNQTILPG